MTGGKTRGDWKEPRRGHERRTSEERRSAGTRDRRRYGVRKVNGARSSLFPLALHVHFTPPSVGFRSVRRTR